MPRPPRSLILSLVHLAYSLCWFLTSIFAYLLAGQLVQQPIPMTNVCTDFGTPTSGTGYLAGAWADFPVDDAGIQAILNVNAERTFWVGYDAGGFAWPTEDVHPILTVTLWLEDGSERWFEVYWSEQTPDRYYALPYDDPTPRADADGQHFGTHPCTAILMTEVEYTALRAALL